MKEMPIFLKIVYSAIIIGILFSTVVHKSINYYEYTYIPNKTNNKIQIIKNMGYPIKYSHRSYFSIDYYGNHVMYDVRHDYFTGYFTGTGWDNFINLLENN